MATIKRQVNRDGSVSYRVRIRLKGTKTQSASFDRKTDASRWAQQTEAAIREGRYFQTNESQRHTLNDLILRYMECILPHKSVSTQINQRTQLRWWDERIGELSLASITPVIIGDGIRELMSEELSGSTANRYLAVIRHCFNYAVNELEWMPSNPAMKITKPKENKGRERYLSEEERERLLEVCKASGKPLLYPAVLVAISTGMRKSEQFSLKWRDINLDNGRAILRETKNGETRAVPLTGPALTILREMSKVRLINNEYIFPGRVRGKQIDLRKSFSKALEEAQIGDFRWHDLRHTFASYMAMNGATLPVLMDAMGHKTLDMVKRYAHLTEGHISSQVASMTKKVFGGVE